MSSENNIIRLDDETIHQIAAGEVVQSPSAALKEMIENCLDAGATKVQVIGDDGGLALLQVSDNGHGIAKEDFPLICTRFATSKLKTIEDLKSLETFGFRGEALAAISYCARVRITSRRKDCEEQDAQLGYCANFLNGKMIEEEPQLVPFGGTVGSCGTIIQVEDLFYNAPLRRQAYGRTQEEWNRIVDVVSKYALQNHHVGFSCSKRGAVKMDVALPPNSTFQGVVSAVKVGGSNVAKHLRTLEDKHLITASGGGTNNNNNNNNNPSSMIMMMAAAAANNQQQTSNSSSNNNNNSGLNFAKDVLESFSFQGYYTDIPFCSMVRKPTLILFVNNRLVESSSIRRIVDMAYAQYLIGAARGWWVFLSIKAKPDTVDANVHPTKHEVMMLNEPAITASIFDALKKGLNANVTAQNTGTLSSTSAAKLQQSVNVSAANLTQRPISQSSSGNQPAAAPCTVARVNEQRGSMLKFVVPTSQLQKKQNAPVADEDDDDDDEVVFVKEEKNGSSSSSSLSLPQRRERETGGDSDANNHKSAKQQDSAPALSTEEILHDLFGEQNNNNKDDSDDDDENDNVPPMMMMNSNNKQNNNNDNTANDDDDDDDDDEQAITDNFKKFQLEKKREEERLLIKQQQRQNQNQKREEQLQQLQEEEEEEEDLTSIINIRNSFRNAAHPQYALLLRKTALVGSIDSQKALIQCDTSLLLLDVPGAIFYLAEQRVFFAPCWSKLPRWELEEPVELKSEILKTLKLPCFKKVLGLASAEKVAESVLSSLVEWSDMLDEYFAISIRDEKKQEDQDDDSAQAPSTSSSSSSYSLVAVPALFGLGLEVQVQDLIGPFLLRLATEVNFEDEEACFRGIGREIAFLYAACAARVEDHETLLRDVVIPSLRGTLLTPLSSSGSGKYYQSSSSNEEMSKMVFYASEEMVKKFVVQPLVSTEQLYRVFERC